MKKASYICFTQRNYHACNMRNRTINNHLPPMFISSQLQSIYDK